MKLLIAFILSVLSSYSICAKEQANPCKEFKGKPTAICYELRNGSNWPSEVLLNECGEIKSLSSRLACLKLIDGLSIPKDSKAGRCLGFSYSPTDVESEERRNQIIDDEKLECIVLTAHELNQSTLKDCRADLATLNEQCHPISAITNESAKEIVDKVIPALESSNSGANVK
jgi:hypothetical protein